jgi:hypothetical protein
MKPVLHLSQNQAKTPPKKETYRPISLMNIDWYWNTFSNTKTSILRSLSQAEGALDGGKERQASDAIINQDFPNVA